MAATQRACLFICDLQISPRRKPGEAAGVHDIADSPEADTQGRPWLCHTLRMTHGKLLRPEPTKVFRLLILSLTEIQGGFRCFFVDLAPGFVTSEAK